MRPDGGRWRLEALRNDFPCGPVVKKLPALQAPWVRSLVLEGPTCCNYGSMHAREPVLQHKRDHRNEKPTHGNEKGAHIAAKTQHSPN